MALRNALPLGAPAPWSATVPQQALELITTWDMDERDALAAPPDPDLAWAEVGTHVAVGSGIVKIPHAMPSSLDFERFKPGGTRNLKSFDAVVTKVQGSPFDLSFGIPMIWDSIGNGYRLMTASSEGGQSTLIDFMGIGGVGAMYVVAGRAYKAQIVGNLLYTGMYCTGSNITMTTPTALAYGGDVQGAASGGIALFTDGTGAANSVGDQQYANPRVSSSARFKNVFSAFGEFSANYGSSLVKMTQTPHATLANKYSGARVTDTVGPSYMRDKFWRMMVQSLTMQTQVVSGTGVAAAASNPYAMAQMLGLTEENFLGQTIQTAFGPRRFWIASEMDNHPYVVANPNTNGTGIPGDMWMNVSAGSTPGSGQKRPTWAKLICNNKDFVPLFRFYGPGDPRAEHELLMRFEGNLDAGATGGAPGEAQVFFQV
jgi:hypothetical protein